MLECERCVSAGPQAISTSRDGRAPIIGGVIRIFEWRPQKKGAARVDLDRFAGPPPDGWVWVDVESGGSSETLDVGRRLGIPDPVLEEAFGSTNFPLLEEHADFLYLVTMGFESGGGERLKTTEVNIFAGSNFLMTIHDTPLPTLGWLQERIEAGAELVDLTPVALLAHMTLASSRRYVPLIHELESQIDGLEELAMVGDPRTIADVHALRRDVILLQRALGPQRRVSEDVTDSDHPLIDPQARQVFEKVADHQARVMDSLDAARAMLASALETHRGAVADQTNEIVRVLTVFSAVMLPLGLIAGIWGMNFERIPGAAQTWGFLGILGVMLLIAGALWVYFVRRGFVGAPRLRELPRSVGIGLIQVGTAPIRAVAGGIESTMRYVSRGGQGPGAE